MKLFGKERLLKKPYIIGSAALLIAISAAVVMFMFPGNTPAAVNMSGDTVSLTVSNKEVYILHTNDTHGCAVHDEHSVIGFNYIAGVKKAFGNNAVLVDAGDFSNGYPFAALTKGAAVQEVMGAAGYDIGTVGNHEFDFADNVTALAERSAFPLISANITKDGQTFLPPTAVKELPNGVKAGFIGLTTPETPYKSNAAAVVGYDFGTLESLIQLTRSYAASLRAEGCDIVVALVHLGTDASTTETSVALADGVGGLVDAIIDGHSHTPPQSNQNRNGVWIVSAGGENNSNVGLLRFRLTDGKYTAEPFYITYDIASGHYRPVPKVTELIQKHNEPIEEMKRTVIGHTDVFLDGAREHVRTGETNLGNLAADAVREFTGAQISLVNGGAIRESLQTGDITYNDMFTAFPFGTVMLKAEVKGSVIFEALEVGVGDYPGMSGGFPHVSGMLFVFDPSREKGSRVISATVQGRSLDQNAVYTMGTIDFPAGGNDGLSMLVEPFSSPIPYEFPAGFEGDTTMMNVVRWYMNAFDITSIAEGRVTAVEIEEAA